MRLPRTGVILLALGLLACPTRAPEEEEAPAPPPAPEEAPAAPAPHPPIAPDDDPLPPQGEIPAFLAPRLPGSGVPTEAEGDDEEGSAPRGAPGAPDAAGTPRGGLGYLFVHPAEDQDPTAPPTMEAHEAPAFAGANREVRDAANAPSLHEPSTDEAAAGSLALRPGGTRAPAEPPTHGPHEAPASAGANREVRDAADAPSLHEPSTDEAAAGLLSLRPGESRHPADALPPDPCQPLRDAIARHQDYLHRTHDERRAFGWVEDDEDASALRLLEGLRRCEAHPDDPDCAAPPLEADLADRTLESHEYSRDPSDLNAEGKEPDEIPHDPRMLDLLEKLRRCEGARRPPRSGP